MEATSWWATKTSRRCSDCLPVDRLAEMVLAEAMMAMMMLDKAAVTAMKLWFTIIFGVVVHQVMEFWCTK